MSEKRNKKKLSARQEAFINEYLIDLNASASARRAGYSEKSAASSARRNLKNPLINKRIENSMEKRKNRTEIDQDYVLQSLQKVVELCLKSGVDLDEKGNEISEIYRFNPNGANKALELMGRHLHMFSDADKDENPEAGRAFIRIIQLPDNGRDGLKENENLIK